MADRRCPVQTSAVYLVRSPPFPSIPPPSPPSPVTPQVSGLCSPIEELSLDAPVPAPVPSPASSPASAPASPTLTPSDTTDDGPSSSTPDLDDCLATAVHVLNTEAAALAHIAQLYATDPAARSAFSRAVDIFARTASAGGKLVLVGVGKSGHIARKLVATLNSLALRASFLHPVEALHGDLGHLDPARDALLLITYSGRTPELLSLLPHLDARAPLVLLTAALGGGSAVARARPGAVVLPACVHELETSSFGLAAPTTSTTVALAVGDAVALATSREVHACRVGHVFARNHPGGAIGAAVMSSSSSSSSSSPVVVQEHQRDRKTAVRELVTAWRDVPLLGSEASTGAEALRVAVCAAQAGMWVRSADGGVLVPRRLRGLEAAELGMDIGAVRGLVVPAAKLVRIRADEMVADVARRMRRASAGYKEEDPGLEVLLVVDEYGRETVGVVDLATLLAHPEAA